MASKLSEKQLDILVKTVLGEARGEGVQGMESVAQVIRNRANSDKYPSDPMEVALQPNQFSTWNRGEGGNNPQQFKPGTQLYETAKQAIERVFSGETVDPTNGALFYHTPQVNPGWSKSVNKYGTTQIGNHIFYNGNPVPPRDIPNVVASQLDVRPPAVTGYPSDLPPMLAAQRNLQPSRVDDSFYRGIFNPADMPVDWSSVPASAGQTIATVPTRQSVPPMMSYAGQERGPGMNYSARTIATVPTRQSVSGQVSYAGQERGAPQTAVPYSAGTTIAAVPTRQSVPSTMSYAGQERATPTPYSAGTTIATVPTRQSVPTTMSYAGQERGTPTSYSAKTIATVPTVEQAAKPKATALSRDSVSQSLAGTSAAQGKTVATVPTTVPLPTIPLPSSPVGVQESNIQKQRAEQQLMRAGVPKRIAVAAVNSPTQPNSIAKYQDRLAPSSIPMVGAAPVASAVPIAPVQTANVPLPRARPTRAQSAPLMASIGQAAGRIGNAIAAPVQRAVAPIMAAAAQSPAAQPLTSSSKLRYGAGEATDVFGNDMSLNPISIQNSERWLTGY